MSDGFLRRAVAIVLLLWMPTSHAYFQETLIADKVMARQDVQWNFLDWLQQRNRMELMDAWLALNSSANFFDLTMSGGYRTYDFKVAKPGEDETIKEICSQYYELEMYLSILSLYGEYETTDNSRENFGAGAGLRILGTSTQDTSLVLRYGFRKTADLLTQERWDSRYAEGRLQFYLASFLGLDGGYRLYFANTSGDGNRLEGSRATVGLFAELLIFRVYGQLFQEPMKITNGDGGVTRETRRGGEVGLRMLF